MADKEKDAKGGKAGKDGAKAERAPKADRSPEAAARAEKAQAAKEKAAKKEAAPAEKKPREAEERVVPRLRTHFDQVVRKALSDQFDERVAVGIGHGELVVLRRRAQNHEVVVLAELPRELVHDLDLPVEHLGRGFAQQIEMEAMILAGLAPIVERRCSIGARRLAHPSPATAIGTAQAADQRIQVRLTQRPAFGSRPDVTQTVAEGGERLRLIGRIRGSA